MHLLRVRSRSGGCGDGETSPAGSLSLSPVQLPGSVARRTASRAYTGAAMPDRIRTELEVLDERFQRCDGDSWMQRLYTGCRWAEGAAYFPAGGYLVFSDVPNDRILRLDEPPGTVGVLRAPAGYANGHTVDRQGRLISCEHGTRQVTRTEHDGSVTVLASHYDGKRLNSPNDV